MNRISLNFITVLILLTCLSGCITPLERSTNHCLRGDWLAKGFDSGKRGGTFKHEWQVTNSSCEKFNLWSNQADFKHGYDLGKQAFCQADNGFEFGVRNLRYDSICDADTQRAFDIAYQDGRQLYYAKHEVRSAEAELEHTLRRIDEIYYKREDLAEKLESEELDKSERERIIERRRELKRKRRYAMDRLPSCRAELRHAERELNHLYSSLELQYDVHGSDSENVYSIAQTLESENRLVKEPAIIVYHPIKPTLDGNFTSSRQLKSEIELLTEHIRNNYRRAFRYQVLKSAELSFITLDGAETRVDLQNAYQRRPRILFWHPKVGLNARALAPAVSLLADVDAFIRNSSPSSLINAGSAVEPNLHND